MEQKRLCPYCMGELPHAADSCVHCGKVFAGRNPAGCLPVGTVLAGRYTVGEMRSLDGEGILYRGVENLGCFRVTIKEYLPVTLSAERGADCILQPKTGSEVLFKTTRMDFADLYRALERITPATGLEAVLDVVYNPDKTELILRAEEAGVPVAVGGLEMLVAQAVYAAEYFLDRKFEDAPAEIRHITAALRRDILNIALIGMPSCGKTTIGKLLAKQLDRPFVDLDEEIVKTDGRSIPDIFAAEGEDAFRARETAETRRFGMEKHQLISCGGGIVKRPENLRALHQNGVVLFIDRPVEQLTVGGGRPLSSSVEALHQMEAQRRPLYLAAADAVIPNTGTLDEALRAAMEALDEIFDS